MAQWKRRAKTAINGIMRACAACLPFPRDTPECLDLWAADGMHARRSWGTGRMSQSRARALASQPASSAMITTNTTDTSIKPLPATTLDTMSNISQTATQPSRHAALWGKSMTVFETSAKWKKLTTLGIHHALRRQLIPDTWVHYFSCLKAIKVWNLAENVTCPSVCLGTNGWWGMRCFSLPWTFK